MAFGENMSEVYIGATKTEQSKIVWNEIKAQMNGCEDLKKSSILRMGKLNTLKRILLFQRYQRMLGNLVMD